MTDDIIIEVGGIYAGAAFARTGRTVARGLPGWDPSISFTLTPVEAKGVMDDLEAEFDAVALALLLEVEVKVNDLKRQIQAWNEDNTDSYTFEEGEDDYIGDLDE